MKTLFLHEKWGISGVVGKDVADFCEEFDLID